MSSHEPSDIPGIYNMILMTDKCLGKISGNNVS